MPEKSEDLETLSIVARLTNNMVLVIDAESKIIWVNEAFTNTMKYSFEEIVSKKPSAILHGSLTDQSSYLAIRYAIDNQKPFQVEIIHYTKDNLPVWVIANGQPIFDKAKALIKYVIVETDITSHKQQQAKLNRSESDLNAFFNNSGSILLLYDTNLKITAFNKKAASFITSQFNYSIQIGADVLKVFKSFELEKFEEFTLKTLNEEGIENYETQLKGADIWWNIRFLPVKDSFGTIIGGSFTAIDITERKNAELILKQSEERYNLVSKATFDAIWDWDIEKNTLFRGEGYFTLFGHQTGLLKNDPSTWDNLIHKDDFNRVISDFQKIQYADFIKWEAEYRYLKSDGTYAYVRDKAIIIRDVSGKAIRMVGAMQDISNQVQREQQLSLLGSVITNTTESILITDRYNSNGTGLKIIYVNDAFSRITGYRQEDVLGKTPKLLQGPLTDTNELKRLKIALENSNPCEIETVNYKKNGDPFWINLSIVPVTNEKSECTHWIAIQQDITERRKQVEERELMILELTKKNNELKQFSYITSHNLRAPVTNMIGILKLIDPSFIADSRTKDLISGLKESTVNLNETLNDLIKVLIIKEDAQIKIEKIHFETKLNKVIQSIKHTIHESGILIEYDFSETAYVNFSEVYFESILINLISNAIKYKLPDRIPELKIHSTISDGCIQLHVTDNGLGMDWEKVKNKIFGLYQRFHNSKDSKGIGLYLVQAQVTALGGSISVKTELGKGSTFIITFKNENE